MSDPVFALWTRSRYGLTPAPAKGGRPAAREPQRRSGAPTDAGGARPGRLPQVGARLLDNASERCLRIDAGLVNGLLMIGTQMNISQLDDF